MAREPENPDIDDHDDEDDEDNEDDEDDEDSESDDDEEDPLAHLPSSVLARVEKLKVLWAQRESIMEDYLKERAALEKKFESLSQPLYVERAAIVRGDQDDEIAAARESEKENTDDDVADEEKIKGIPQFWATAMTHMDTIGEMMSVEDVDCLEHLTDITCADRDDGKGFTLSFYFAPNDYFTNTVLTKTYEVPNLLTSDSPMLKSVKGETINWKEGKSLTHRTIKKKQRGKGKHKGQVRTVATEEEKESFFHWFTPPVMPAPSDTMDEEEADNLEEIFDNDYDVAQAFRTQVIPKAVLWFTGEALDEDVGHVVQDAIEEILAEQ